MADQPFWIKKSLDEMSQEEWEAVCDRCGKCCLHKLEDEDSGDIYYTSVACQYLSLESCQCTAYANRASLVPGCVTLTRETLRTYNWLPETCSYRVLAQGGWLAEWHPLVSGNDISIHSANMSVKNYAISETKVAEEDFEDYIVKWVI